ncbi:unnamed protein product [Owenia fusiformis]|uniref:Uncharacterized protein n=1 Tax=Owenia fusiformis TaxID=6347 RepID=A0A8J1UKH7_OWEFU|nr:unnamed protein product [Owenia fusiformis]
MSPENGISRPEIIAKIISTLLGLTLSFGVSYFALKWLGDKMDPTHKEKKEQKKQAEKVLHMIGVRDIKLSDYELCIASNLVDPLSMVTSWDDIGGLDDIIQEIKETVIWPFQRQDLFRSSQLLQPPKGVLLYGPPGCGKTMIARAMAKAADARFINLQVSSLVDKWYGESQKRAEAVFSLAIKLQPTIIFIDEIDSFLRSRNSSDHEATLMIKTQFMSFWDGLITDNKCRVMIIGATNRPHDVDDAILRRMPSMFNIGLPNAVQRARILKLILEEENVSGDVELDKIAVQCDGLSGSDLRELCRQAAILRVREHINNEMDENGDESFHDATQEVELRSISMLDMTHGLKKLLETKLKPGFPQQISLD